MADRLSPAVTGWMQHDRNTSVALEEITKSACPPLLHALPTAVSSDKPYYGCRVFNDLAVSRLVAAGAAGNSGVILSTAWWPRATDFDLRKIGSSVSRGSFDIHATDTEQSLHALEIGLRASLQEITRNGLRALIVLGSPILIDDRDGRPIDAPECIFRNGDERLCSMAISTHRALTSATNEALSKVANEFSNTAIFDPIPILCTKTRCPAEINGVVAYTDYEHLSDTMFRHLSGSLAPYLEWLTNRRRADVAIR